MDYLQYIRHYDGIVAASYGFKPYYKWITFNTGINDERSYTQDRVLNLIINGLPSIHNLYDRMET